MFISSGHQLEASLKSASGFLKMHTVRKGNCLLNCSFIFIASAGMLYHCRVETFALLRLSDVGGERNDLSCKWFPEHEFKKKKQSPFITPWSMMENDCDVTIRVVIGMAAFELRSFCVVSHIRI